MVDFRFWIWDWEELLGVVKYRQMWIKEIEMKVNDKTIQELEELEPSEVLRV